MTANSQMQTVIGPAMGVIDASPDSPHCKVWREHAKAWCDEFNAHKKAKKAFKDGKGPDPGPLKRGSFNDRFFPALEKAGIPGVRREFPLGATRGSGAFTMGEVAAKLGGEGELAELAAQSGDMFTRIARGAGGAGAGFWDNARGLMRTELEALQGQGYHPFFPDGMQDGTALEVKAPGDKIKKNQGKKYAKTAPNKTCLIISAKGCDPNGDFTTPKGNCKAAPK
jgi:hypothetical protein